VIESTCVEFVFGPRVVVAHVESAEIVSSVLSPFFASFFSENYPFEFSSPYGNSPENMIPQRQLLPSIYVSFCHSLEIPMNDVLFSLLQKECAKSSNRLNISKLEIDSQNSARSDTRVYARPRIFESERGDFLGGVQRVVGDLGGTFPPRRARDFVRSIRKVSGSALTAQNFGRGWDCRMEKKLPFNGCKFS
jgi:hypothetical protein